MYWAYISYIDLVHESHNSTSSHWACSHLWRWSKTTNRCSNQLNLSLLKKMIIVLHVSLHICHIAFKRCTYWRWGSQQLEHNKPLSTKIRLLLAIWFCNQYIPKCALKWLPVVHNISVYSSILLTVRTHTHTHICDLWHTDVWHHCLIRTHCSLPNSRGTWSVQGLCISEGFSFTRSS